jgi:hypothetical protein
MHSEPANKSKPAVVALLICCALSVTGCATQLPVMPPALPTIPQAPAVQEPPPSGYYWTMLCELQRRVQLVLNSTQATLEPCETAGR